MGALNLVDFNANPFAVLADYQPEGPTMPERETVLLEKHRNDVARAAVTKSSAKVAVQHIVHASLGCGCPMGAGAWPLKTRRTSAIEHEQRMDHFLRRWQ
jgi:hypothetical protein